MECLDSQILLEEERELDVLLMLDFLSLCVFLFFIARAVRYIPI